MDDKCLTWNINGTDAPQKRKILLFEKLKQDIICLQETHIIKMT